MKKDNVEVDEEKNWIKVKVDTTVFNPQTIVVAANEFTDDSWVVMNTDSEGDVIVKLLPKESFDEGKMRELGLEFQTDLVAKSVETVEDSQSK